jgi:hypothetical protein
VEHAGLQAFMGVPSLEDPTAIERWTVLIDPRSRKVRHIYKVIGPQRPACAASEAVALKGANTTP